MHPMIYSAAHQCVIYKTNPAPVCGAIPGARAINGHYVAVPADLFSLQLARLLGLPVPPFLEMVNYDWPIAPGRKPLSHQRYMANFMVLHPRSYNLSDMGTMKTLAALWALDYLMGQGVIKKALIISPLSTLRPVWDKEIFLNFCGRRTCAILHGTREQRLEKLQSDVDIYVINTDGFGIGSKKTHRSLIIGPLAEQIRARKDIGAVVIDEASNFKAAAALRTRVLREMIKDKPIIWPMSGTPTPQAPTDAYSLARLLDKLQGVSFRDFQARTMFQVSNFRWLPRANAAETVRQALSPAVRFSREECIDLPECVVETRDVALSPTQEKAYKELKRDLQVVLKGGKTITAVNEASLRIKLLQITSGAVYGANREVHKTDAAPRLAVLKEVIDEAGAKIIVFASFTSVVDMLAFELRQTYGENTVARVYGDTSQSARSEIFWKFEADTDPRIIVADPGTMSHGLTLVAASTIVWWGPTDRLETYQQANARINRPGQKNRMLIVRLAGTKIEAEIYRRLEEKSSLQGVILKLAEGDR